MFKDPPVKRVESLNRIARNTSIFYAVFYKHEPLRIKAIYKVDPNVMLAETERQLDRSRNAISHVGFSEDWALMNGSLVYSDG